MLQSYLRYPRLYRRNHTFYIRVVIPRVLQPLALRKEFIYSLHTRDYFVAIKMYPKESLAMDTIIDLLRIVALKISKRSYPFGITLDDTDIDSILVHRMEEIQKYCEEHFTEIEKGKFYFDDISLFKNMRSEKFYYQRPNTFYAGQYLTDYLLWLKEQPDTHITLKNVIDTIDKGLTNIPTHSHNYNCLEHEDWFQKYVNKLEQVEEYNRKMVEDIQKSDTSADKYAKRNPLIRKLKAVCQDRTNKKIAQQRKIKTLWTTLFERMISYRNAKKTIKKSTVEAKKMHLKTIFALLEKECVDDITADDCKRVSMDMHKVPKRWNILYPHRRINSVLGEYDGKKSLSPKTINSYLTTFQEFLQYAADEEIIKDSFKRHIIIPLIDKEPQHLSFTTKDLKKIFNPDTYPNRYNRYEFVKFWVPLIALYQGMRINEICQLRVVDIEKVGTIWCFNIRAEHELQSLKNKHSKRIIPIHQTLISLGFIDFVKRLKHNKKEFIFYTLKFQRKNQFAGSVGHWFARYIEKLNIKTSDKVFHSFRYTFEQKAIEAKISTEVQNALGGWCNKGIGQSIYGRQFNMAFLKRELNKIEYPCLKSILENFAYDPKQKDFSTSNYELSKEIK